MISWIAELAGPRNAMFGPPCLLAAAVCFLQMSVPMVSHAQGAITVEIVINNTSDPADDYLCWSPRPARARILGTPSNDIRVVISSESISSASTGAAVFQADKGMPPNWESFAPKDTLELMLPADGSWTSFYLAGKAASTNEKDFLVMIREAPDGLKLGSISAMVRVRKDARKLTAVERRKFLEAVSALHDAGHFDKYWRAHEAAPMFSIHFSYNPYYKPLFLAWHRAFILNFERNLQQLDPDVALPYWKFDELSYLSGQDSIFSADFLGGHDESLQIVRFNDSLSANQHPWFNWRVPGRNQLLTRQNHPDRNRVNATLSGPVDADRLSKILKNLDSHRKAAGEIELTYHNGVHRHVGGWLAKAYSPADPLFFLLHANVDRAFAHWQEAHGSWDWTGTDDKSYHATGEYPGAAADYLKGSYALDEMWPWNPGQPRWPSDMLFRMPAGVNGNRSASAPAPTPASQIDYLNLSGETVASGACYDDIGYIR